MKHERQPVGRSASTFETSGTASRRTGAVELVVVVVPGTQRQKVERGLVCLGHVRVSWWSRSSSSLLGNGTSRAHAGSPCCPPHSLPTTIIPSTP